MAFQDDLDRLYERSVKNRLYFNHENCANVNFNGESYPLYFGNNQITMKENQKDLGLLVDSGLRWKTHIEKACSKANAVFFQIKRNVSNLSMKTILELYKSMIVPTLIYASSDQGNFVTSHLGDNMASVTWATKVSTKCVDQIDQLTNIFKEVSMFVVYLGRFAPFAK